MSHATGLVTTGSSTPRNSTDRVLQPVSHLHRSIRFQDEESTDQQHLDKQSRIDSLELSPLVDTRQSEIGAGEYEYPFQMEEHIDEDDSERGRQMFKNDTETGTMSKPSIYQSRTRYHQSESRTSTHRSWSRELNPVASRRISFAGSASSVPRLLLRTSVSSFEAPYNIDDLQELPPEVGRKASILLLIMSALLVAVCVEFLVNTLDDIISSRPFSQTFIGLIILPIVGNCAEHITATTVAAKGNFDLAIGVSVGSSVQIALFVAPLIVIGGWILDRDMIMYPGIFGGVALVATTFLVNFLILHSKTNFLEGSLLCACYVIIGIGAYLSPDSEPRSGD